MTTSKTPALSGISEQILTSLGARRITRDKRPALLLPTMPDYQSRVVFLDGKYKKYAWEHKDQPHPPLFCYLPDGTKLAVITNGEKASLVLAQQGIPCANTFGEGNELGRAVEALQAAGVTSLLIVPDCDKAGIRAAHKWLTVAKEAGLEVAILDLGAYLKRAYLMTAEEYHKYDLRDLWLLLEQDSDIFKEVLYSLPHVNFDDYQDWLPQAETREEFRPNYKPSPDQPDLLKLYHEWWNTEVLLRVSLTAPHGRIHKHQQCRNPHHDDHNPSFRITEQGNPVCTCGKVSYDDVALWFGALSWEEYRKQRQPPKDHVNHAAKKVAPPKRELNALPELIRLAMLRLKHTRLAHFLDVILLSGKRPGETFTLPEIKQVVSLSSRGLAKLVTESFCTFENSEEHQHKDYSTQKCRNSNVGRKAVLYRIPTFTELAKTYAVEADHLVPLPLPVAAMESKRTYAAFTMRDLLPSAPTATVSTKKSMRELAEEMNVSTSTVSTYRKVLEEKLPGFAVIPTEPHKQDISLDGIGKKLDDVLERIYNASIEALRSSEKKPKALKAAWLEMLDKYDGVRYPHYTKQKYFPDGTPKPLSNKIPLVLGAVLHFIKQGVEVFRLCIKQPNTWVNPPRPERIMTL